MVSTTSKSIKYIMKFLLLAVSILFFAGAGVSAEETTEVPQGSTEAILYTVMFVTNSESSVDAQSVEAGKTAAEPSIPAKEGFDFTGWYVDEQLMQKYDFSQPVNADITLYAGWAEKEDSTTEEKEPAKTEAPKTEAIKTEADKTETTKKETTEKKQTAAEKFTMNVNKLDMTKANFVSNVKALRKTYKGLTGAEKNKVSTAEKKLKKYENAIKNNSCGSGTYYYYDSSSKTLTIFGKGKTKNLFTKFYEKKGEKQLKKAAYNKVKSKVKKVVVGEGVTYVGNGTFAYMKSLTSAEIKGSSTNFGKCVFFGCKKLSKVTFVDSAKSNRTIGFGVFGQCTALKNIIIPEGTKKIDQSAFYECKKLSSIVLPSTLTEVGATCFYDCTSLKTITVSGNIKKCGNDAFYGTRKKGRKVVCKTKKAKKCKFVKEAKKAGFKIK